MAAFMVLNPLPWAWGITSADLCGWMVLPIHFTFAIALLHTMDIKSTRLANSMATVGHLYSSYILPGITLQYAFARTFTTTVFPAPTPPRTKLPYPHPPCRYRRKLDRHNRLHQRKLDQPSTRWPPRHNRRKLVCSLTSYPTIRLTAPLVSVSDPKRLRKLYRGGT